MVSATMKITASPWTSLVRVHHGPDVVVSDAAQPAVDDRGRRDGRRGGHRHHQPGRRLRLHHSGRDQEVPGRSAGALQPRESIRALTSAMPRDRWRQVHPARGAGRGLDGRPNTHARRDTYEIGLVQYRTSFSSDLPARWCEATSRSRPPLMRGDQPALPALHERAADRHDGQTSLDAGGHQVRLTPPQYLGPTIVATKDRAVRIVFHNYLPTGVTATSSCRWTRPSWARAMGLSTCRRRKTYGTVMDEVRNPACGEPDR